MNYYFPKTIKRTKSIEDFLEKDVAERYYLPQYEVVQFLATICNKRIKSCCRSMDPVGGKLIRQIPTPVCINGSYPTILASDSQSFSHKNYTHTANHPRPGVLEIWHNSVACVPDYKMILAAGESCLFSGSNSSKVDIIKAVNSLSCNHYFRLRCLTVREKFRLMGVSENDIDKLLSSGVKEKELHVQAGNSIVVDVLYHLFRELLSLESTPLE